MNVQIDTRDISVDILNHFSKVKLVVSTVTDMNPH